MTEVAEKPTENRKGRGIYKNSLLNLLGQLFPLGIAAVAVPFIIRDMGLERYGLLSLAWILLGYFSFLDLGLGRATTNAVADLDASGKREQIGAVVTLSLFLNLGVGLAAAVVGWFLTPWLVKTAFALPLELQAESAAMFSVLAVSIPIITVAATLRGVLEGFHRFDLSNAVRSPSLALMFLLPLLYGPLHLNLGEVVGLIVISRVLAVAVFAWFVRKVDHRAFSLRSRFTGSMRQLLRYAGWVTVSNIFSPVLNFAERLLLAALMPLGMIGFYTAPYEIISRLPMIPASIGMALFPSFSSGLGASGETALERLFVRPTKLILFIVTPLTAFFVFFPREILSLWLGADFGEKSHGVLVFLAVGFFLNCLAHVPLAAMYGLGRPDLRAKIDITEAFVFVVASYAMIVLGGITGAAATKAAALGLDVIAMFLLLERILKVGLRSLMPDHLLYFALTSFSFLGIGLVLDLSSVDLAMKLTSFLVAGVVFVYLFVTRFLTADERAMAFSVARFQNWP